LPFRRAGFYRCFAALGTVQLTYNPGNQQPAKSGGGAPIISQRSSWTNWNKWFIPASVILAAMFSGQPLAAEVLDKVADIAGTKLQYKIVLPNGYDATKAYPAILAFPGGPQAMSMVEGTVARNWREQAEIRGYIVIVPAAPNGELFFQEGDRVFPAFITKLLGDFKILQNKFHIAGVSNGGLSAFHIASLYPQYFWSVTGLPGFLDESSPQRVRALAKMCIYMYAGEEDPSWLQSEREEAAKFQSQGFTVEFNEEKGQGHVMRTLEGPGAARLFKQFEQARQGCGK
jgi:poly(3-hydroxybutyrate) depolymerase